MKLLFATILGWCACLPMSMANAAPVQEVHLSTQTCDSISISSQTATAVVNSTSSAGATDFTQLFLLNLSTSSSFMCSNSAHVSTRTTVSNLAGGVWFDKAVTGAVGSAASIVLFPGEVWYCLNDSGDVSGVNQGSYRLSRCRMR